MALACHPRMSSGPALFTCTRVGLLRENPNALRSLLTLAGRCPAPASSSIASSSSAGDTCAVHSPPHDRAGGKARRLRRAPRPGEVPEGGEAALPAPLRPRVDPVHGAARHVCDRLARHAPVQHEAHGELPEGLVGLPPPQRLAELLLPVAAHATRGSVVINMPAWLGKLDHPGKPRIAGRGQDAAKWGADLCSRV